MMNKQVKFRFLSNKKYCSHCGGLLRYYRESITCLMCGRDLTHICKECSFSESMFRKKS